MIEHTSTYPTLLSAIWSDDRTGSKTLRPVLMALVGTAFLTLCAKIQVPFYPVPMTMGTFAVLAIGMTYGWRLATATLLLYMAEGAAGLPVFAGTPEKGIGLAYMMGGTGGYLLGYVLAAAACGWLAERGWDRNFSSTVLVMLVGNALIYVPGLLWLGALFGWDKPILEWGLTPFILGDVTKLALAAAIIPFAWSLVRKWKQD